MSNHGHLVATFPDGNTPDFMELFGSLTARCLNAVLGINGSVIEKGHAVTVAQDDEKLLEHCAYTLANPCAGDLVTRARHWKGVTSAGLNFGDTKLVEKPKVGIWNRRNSIAEPKPNAHRDDRKRRAMSNRSKLPDTVELTLVRPPIFDAKSDIELQQELNDRVATKEAAAEALRVEKGEKVLGMKRVRKIFWGAMPGKEDMFGLKPRISASLRRTRVEAIETRRVFVNQYREAKRRWLDGDKAVMFPAGTWLMQRRFGACCVGGSGVEPQLT